MINADPIETYGEHAARLRAERDIDAQPVVLNVTLGQAKMMATLAAQAVTDRPDNTAFMALLLALQAEGGREQERLRTEGYR